MIRRIVIVVGAVAALGLAWWLGRWAADDSRPRPVVATSSTKSMNRAPSLPAPVMRSAPAEAEPSPSPPTRLLGDVMARLNAKGNGKLTGAQVAKYLADNHRDAESLIAASRATGDVMLLREAVQRFPNDPRVQFERLRVAESAAERVEAAAALAAADPTNAMGSYLAANEAFKSGNADEAVRRLSEAASRMGLNDFSREMAQAGEDAFVAAGYSPLEAKVASAFGLPMPQVTAISDLSKQMNDLARSYAERGDAASAQAVREMGIELGQRVQSSMNNWLISTLVGQSAEMRFLKEMSPAQVLESGQTVQQRIDELAAQKDTLKSLVRTVDPTNANLTEALFLQYMDRQKALGELAAMQWLKAKLEVKP